MMIHLKNISAQWFLLISNMCYNGKNVHLFQLVAFKICYNKNNLLFQLVAMNIY